MKIKPEYEKEMLEKVRDDLDTVLSLIQNIDMSLALSNYKELNTLFLEVGNNQAYGHYKELYYKVHDVLKENYKEE